MIFLFSVFFVLFCIFFIFLCIYLIFFLILSFFIINFFFVFCLLCNIYLTYISYYYHYHHHYYFFFRTHWEELVERFSLNNRYVGRMVKFVITKLSSPTHLHDVSVCVCVCVCVILYLPYFCIILPIPSLFLYFLMYFSFSPFFHFILASSFVKNKTDQNK